MAALQSIARVCLCCQMFVPSIRDTIIRYPGRDGQHQFRVSGYDIAEEFEETCWVSMRREKNVDVYCPDNMFLVSKPLLTSSSSPSTSYTMFECQDNPPSNDIVSRRYIKLNKALTLGSTVSVIATPTQNDSISIHLLSPNKDSHLVYTIGFLFGKSTNTIRRSVHIKGRPTGLETDTPYFPYALKREFNTTIEALEDQFKIYVDNAELCNFKHRVPNPEIVAMRVVGTIEYRSIIIT